MRNWRQQPDDGSTIASATSRRVDQRSDARDGDLILDDVLVEDVSIDGMCGVY